MLIVTEPELLADLSGLCDRLLDELREPTLWNGQNVQLSATMGVAAIGGSNETSIGRRGMAFDRALECADAALYVAKEKARGSVMLSAREDQDLSHNTEEDWPRTFRAA